MSILPASGRFHGTKLHETLPYYTAMEAAQTSGYYTMGREQTMENDFIILFTGKCPLSK